MNNRSLFKIYPYFTYKTARTLGKVPHCLKYRSLDKPLLITSHFSRLIHNLHTKTAKYLLVRTLVTILTVFIVKRRKSEKV